MTDSMDLEELAQYDSDEDGNSTDTNSHDRMRSSARASDERRAISTISAAPAMKSGTAPFLLSGIRGKSSGETNRQTTMATPSQVFDRNDTPKGTYDGAANSSVASTTRHKFSFSKKRELPPIPPTGFLPPAVCEVLEEFYQAKGYPNKDEVTLLRALVGYSRALPVRGRPCRIEGWFVRRQGMNVAAIKAEPMIGAAAGAHPSQTTQRQSDSNAELPQHPGCDEKDGKRDEHEGETMASDAIDAIGSVPRKRRRRPVTRREEEDEDSPPAKRKRRSWAREVAEKEATLWRGQDGEFEVDQLVDHRAVGDDGALEYLVRWRNCDARFDTWEPESNLSATSLVFYAHKRQLRAAAERKSVNTETGRATIPPATQGEDGSRETAVPTQELEMAAPARSRLHVNAAQRVHLLVAHGANSHPTQAERAALAIRLDLPLPDVTKWFRTMNNREKALTVFPVGHPDYKQCAECKATTTIKWRGGGTWKLEGVVCSKCYGKHCSDRKRAKLLAARATAARVPFVLRPLAYVGSVEPVGGRDGLIPTRLGSAPAPGEELVGVPGDTCMLDVPLQHGEAGIDAPAFASGLQTTTVSCVDCDRPTANTCQQGLRLAICELCQMYRNSHGGRSRKEQSPLLTADLYPELTNSSARPVPFL